MVSDGRAISPLQGLKWHLVPLRCVKTHRSAIARLQGFDANCLLSRPVLDILGSERRSLKQPINDRDRPTFLFKAKLVAHFALLGQ